jgi:hypothetical protein
MASLRPFQRKLKALEYPLWDRFDVTGTTPSFHCHHHRHHRHHHYIFSLICLDSAQYRTLVVWLEDSKIR